MLEERIILPDAHTSAADDTEVVPPKNRKQLDRPEHVSMPYSLVEDESFFNPDYA
jgi:hypothetical protein